MKTIKLSDEVMVSDPCYQVPTWCQHKLTGVLPGEYITAAVKTDNTAGWGSRVAVLKAVHKDHNSTELSWRTLPADIGVDSGQCGIFSMETYRNDAVFMEKSGVNFNSDRDGDHWYNHMCDRTLNDNRYGTYSGGIVSSSGFGDGSYRLLVAKSKGKIVGIAVDFYVLKFSNKDLNHLV